MSLHIFAPWIEWHQPGGGASGSARRPLLRLCGRIVWRPHVTVPAQNDALRSTARASPSVPALRPQPRLPLYPRVRPRQIPRLILPLARNLQQPQLGHSAGDLQPPSLRFRFDDSMRLLPPLFEHRRQPRSPPIEPPQLVKCRLIVAPRIDAAQHSNAAIGYAQNTGRQIPSRVREQPPQDMPQLGARQLRPVHRDRSLNPAPPAHLRVLFRGFRLIRRERGPSRRGRFNASVSTGVARTSAKRKPTKPATARPETVNNKALLRFPFTGQRLDLE